MTKKNIIWWVLTHHKSENSLSLCFQPYQGKQARQIQLNFKFKSISIMCFRFIASKILIKMFIKSQLLLLSLQSCLTLCDPIDGGPPGSPVPGILQARTLEWVAISFSNAWKWKVKVKSLSRVQFLATPRTAAHQAPPSMGFSRQEYWSAVPLPSPWRARLILNKNLWNEILVVNSFS